MAIEAGWRFIRDLSYFGRLTYGAFLRIEIVRCMNQVNFVLRIDVSADKHPISHPIGYSRDIDNSYAQRPALKCFRMARILSSYRT